MLDDMQEERRLTSFSHGAGCGCKLGPDQLLEVMGSLQLPGVPPEVLVGVDTGDDAAVWALDEDRAIIATLDFFTPIVDDPYDWGRIAATNAMSDVYAMGGTPFLALNIVAWPVDDLPLGMLSSVLQGGVDAATNAGVAVLGGHSITDPEPKFGMVVLGSVDPAQMTTNAGAQPGDTVFLTKPLGLGMISTAAKRGVATDEQLQVALDTMTTLNADAAAAMIRVGVRAATDVTGFGLMGHLSKMLRASGVAATLDAGAVPLLPGVLDLAQRDVVAGGTKRNHASVTPTTDWGACTLPEQYVLADAQTSGGLLIAAPDATALRESLAELDVSHAEIGLVTEGRRGHRGPWQDRGRNAALRPGKASVGSASSRERWSLSRRTPGMGAHTRTAVSRPGRPDLDPPRAPDPRPSFVDGWRQMSWPLRILRAFLGGTFVFAGAQKFLDPNFLRQGSPDFVGTQLRGFATGTPAGPLLRVLGHAPVVTGVAIALTEIAVGLAVLVGAFMVLAAVVGFLINLTLFLSATWHVHPFFLGSDSAYCVMWLAFGVGVWELAARRSRGRLPSLGALADGLDRRTFLRAGTHRRRDPRCGARRRSLAGPIARDTGLTAAGVTGPGPASRSPRRRPRHRRPHPRRRPPPHRLGARSPRWTASRWAARSVSTRPGSVRPCWCGSPTTRWWPTAGSARTPAAWWATTPTTRCCSAPATAPSTTRPSTPRSWPVRRRHRSRPSRSRSIPPPAPSSSRADDPAVHRVFRSREYPTPLVAFAPATAA